MGIRLSKDIAQQRLHEAVKLAASQEPLPEEWLRFVERVGQSPRKIDIALLAAGLLAKSTDERIDPLRIKADAGDRAYSARSMTDGILASAAIVYGFDLGSTSPWPINSSTFLKPRSLDQIEGIDHPESLQYLIQTLRRLDELDAKRARVALAAFLRVRTRIAAGKRRFTVPEAALDLWGIAEATTQFITSSTQDGKRGQAFVAAAYDLVHKDVRTQKVYDPSRHWPGDVQVFQGLSPIHAVEVKQRPVSQADVLRFASELRRRNLDRGAFAALHPDQEPMPGDVVRQVWEREQVFLTWLQGPVTVLLDALAWTPLPLVRALAEFPSRMLSRLEDLEAGEDTQKAWAALFETAAATAAAGSPAEANGRLFDELDP